MVVAKENDRTSTRGQWTLKSRKINAELLNAARLAAKRRAMPIGDWVCEIVWREALRTLGKTVPNREVLTLDKLPTVLVDLFREQMEASEQRLEERQRQERDAGQRQVAEQVAEQVVARIAERLPPPDPPRPHARMIGRTEADGQVAHLDGTGWRGRRGFRGHRGR